MSAPDWTQALCLESNDPDLWFSHKDDDIIDAIIVCHQCPLKRECEQLGKDEPFGVWGGIHRDREKALRSKPRQRVRTEDVEHYLTFHPQATSDEIGEWIGVASGTVANYLRKNNPELHERLKLNAEARGLSAPPARVNGQAA